MSILGQPWPLRLRKLENTHVTILLLIINCKFVVINHNFYYNPQKNHDVYELVACDSKL